jgi:hypothetical protein
MFICLFDFVSFCILFIFILVKSFFVQNVRKQITIGVLNFFIKIFGRLRPILDKRKKIILVIFGQVVLSLSIMNGPCIFYQA